MTASPELDAFLDGRLDATVFDHPAHVRIARELLARHDFLDAANLYVKGIRIIAGRAGEIEKVSVTKTLAFLALIAEGKTPGKGALDAFYSSERLNDPRSRDVFLMPDRTATH